ncbi:hypothetical protein GmHk_03G007804 [Glycine max]|nr:hypothetical protein GmHk_03G007804 [Glycine max]
MSQPEHPSLVHEVWTGVTINQYFGHASRASNNPCTLISQQQFLEMIGNLKDELRKEVKEEHKKSLEKIRQEVKKAIKANIQLLGARLSTNGSCVEAIANPLGEEPPAIDMAIIGLYVVCDHRTCPMALGKGYDSATIIHNVPYADGVVRVTVAKAYDDDAQVPFSDVRDSVCHASP